MATLHIRINLDNAAFEDYPCEVARILQKLIKDMAEVDIHRRPMAQLSLTKTK